MIDRGGLYPWLMRGTVTIMLLSMIRRSVVPSLIIKENTFEATRMAFLWQRKDDLSYHDEKSKSVVNKSL